MTALKTLLAELQKHASLTPDRAKSLPPGAYVNQEIFELEAQRIFAEEWICVGRASDMPAAGDYLTLDVTGASAMVVRQKDGSLKALSRVCRHRAALLADDGRGHADLFVCPYHRWTYELDGRLRGAPAMESNVAFNRADCRLPEFRVEEWLGFVFVNRDASAEPLAPRMRPVADRVARYQAGQLQSAFIIEGTWSANWKILFENGSESYHHMGVHPQTLQPQFPALGIRCEVGGPGYSLHYVPTVQGFDFRQARSAGLGPLTLNPALGNAELGGFLIFGIYPSLALVFAGANLVWLAYYPQEVARTAFRVGWLSPAGAFEGGAAHEIFATDKLALETILTEDKISCERVHRGILAADAAAGPLSPLELPIAEFGRYLARRLGSGV